jgi:ABC-type glycerol-3-phosphate transport system permease component
MTAVGRSRWTTFLLYGSLTVLAVVWLVPMLSALMTSTLPLSQTRAGWWNLSPADLTFGNFARAWDQGLSRYAVNSFIITGLAVVLTVSAGSLAAYAYARMAFRLKATTYFLLITTMIVPVQIILIPMLPWFRTLGLNAGPQEYLGIALVHTAFGAGWAIFMLGGRSSRRSPRTCWRRRGSTAPAGSTSSAASPCHWPSRGSSPSPSSTSCSSGTTCSWP